MGLENLYPRTPLLFDKKIIKLYILKWSALHVLEIGGFDMHGQKLNLENDAAVITLAIKPKDLSILFFVGASIPAENRVNYADLENLQTKYGGRLTISRGTADGRLCIILPCPRVKSLERLGERGGVLQRNIKNILGIHTCMARKGYLELCKCLSVRHPLPQFYRSQDAEEEIRVH